MRSIKFRGKRPNSGKWIYGHLFADGMFAYILNAEYFKAPECSCEVLRETVGQFTGLHDMAGNEIYEGDILYYSEHPKYILPSCNMIVCWDDDNACFGYKMDSLNDFFRSFNDHDELKYDVLDHCELTGNIHDNK